LRCAYDVKLFKLKCVRRRRSATLGGIVIFAITGLKYSGFVVPYVYIVCFLEFINIYVVFKNASTCLFALRKYLLTPFGPRLITFIS
jgi:hypothetical protein